MASQSLYRKWRSQAFSEFVGQEAVIQTLKNALNSGKLAHAYLFTGPRGTGKTSLARLLAKTINCLNPQNGEPCNECEQCREITAGTSFNVIEIDAASNRGIDSIRELRERVMVPPSTGKYKVYILDEAHMLTVEAFNALLKTLEEPPPHAIFVMATTDVHKMLATVLSRCQRFDFKRFTIRQIVTHLKFVAGQEQITLEQGAAELIARAASGGMRDALSLLDQAIAYSGQEISLTKVQAMLGVADPRAIQKFITYVAELDSAGGLHLIHELSESGADLRQINGQIAEYWRAMMLAKAGATIATILDSTDDEVREITQTSTLFSLEELTECARVFAQNDLVQKNQGTPQLGLELALLTCSELHRRAQSGQPVTSTPQTLTPPSNALPQATRSIAKPVVSHDPVRVEPVSPPVVIPPPVTVREEPAPVIIEEETPPTTQTFSPQVEETSRQAQTRQSSEFSQTPTFSAMQEEAQTTIVEEVSSGEPPTLTLQVVKDNWELVRRRIRTKKDGAKVAAYLNGYTLVAVEGTAALPVVVIKANAQFHYASLQQKSGEYQSIIEWGLKVALDVDCKVRILPPNATVRSAFIPPPVAPASPQENDRSTDPTMLAMPRQSARVERSAPVLEPPEEKIIHLDNPRTTVASPVQATVPVENTLSPPLARTHTVRENTSTGVSRPAKTSSAGGTRIEMVRKHASDNPVVQKVVEMFKADIKDIKLK